MNDLMILFLSLSLSGSALALALLALGPIVRRKLSQTWQYYVWLVVVLRFLLPFSPETSLVGAVAGYAEGRTIDPPTVEESVTFRPIVREENENGESFHYPPAGSVNIATPEYEPQERTPPAIDWGTLSDHIWMLWLGTALFMFARKAAGYGRFTRFIRAGSKSVTDEGLLALYREELAGAKVRRALPLYRNNQASSPMLVGMLRPVLVIPDIEASENEYRAIIRHELTHLKRLDFLYKWLVQLTLCLHWFNPLAHYIAGRINKSCELSCDEAVLRTLDERGRVIYGDALIASLSARKNYGDLVVSMTMSEGGKNVKERLDRIMSFRKKTVLSTLTAAGLTVLLLCGFVFAGAYRKTAEPPATPVAEPIEIRVRASENPTDPVEGAGESVKRIKLTVKDSNVRVETAADGGLAYEYDEKRYKITSTTNGSLLNIGVTRLPGVKNELSLPDIVVIYLPPRAYDDITVEGDHAGVGLTELDANLHLTSSYGAISAQVPAGFTKTIDMTSKNGSGSLLISEEAKNYTLSVDAEGSAVGVTPDFPAFTPNQPWRYRNGNGAADISLDLENSSFAISMASANSTGHSESIIEDRAKIELATGAGEPGFLWPVAGGEVSRGFDPGEKLHPGIDIGAVELGDPVIASAAGTVVLAKENWTGFGHYIIIDHGNGYQTLYGHNSELLVEVGDVVGQSQQIAKVGRTGNATGYMLHFEIRYNGENYNPEDYII